MLQQADVRGDARMARWAAAEATARCTAAIALAESDLVNGSKRRARFVLACLELDTIDSGNAVP